MRTWTRCFVTATIALLSQSPSMAGVVRDYSVFSDFINYSTWEQTNLKGLIGDSRYVIFQQTSTDDFEMMTRRYIKEENRVVYMTLVEYLQNRFPAEDVSLLQSFAHSNDHPIIIDRGNLKSLEDRCHQC